MLALSLLLYWNGVRSVEMLLRADVERETAEIVREVEAALSKREAGLISLARSEALRNYVRDDNTTRDASAPESDKRKLPEGNSSPPSAVPAEVQTEIRAFFLSNPKRYVSITCLNAARQPLFRAVTVSRDDGKGNVDTEVQFQTEGFLSSAVNADPRVWITSHHLPVRSSITKESLGATLRLTLPVFTGEEGAPAPRGALIADLSGDELLAESVAGKADETQNSARESDVNAPRSIVMLDRAGNILYHTNVALRHQNADRAIESRGDISESMLANESGWKFYDKENARWLVAYRPVTALGISVAVAANYSATVWRVHRLGWIGIVLSALFGLVMAAVLTKVVRGTARSIERVTEGAVAIAGGKLDQRIEVRSSDETRLLAESFNIMTDKLREQIARETESRQFESFMRLSAMLTHDLKNAISSLSMLVGNIERQFHRAEFRADAMSSLTSATNKLRALVAKLSEPVQSLSSEHQLPRQIDLVPMIRRVLDATVEPVRSLHRIETNLPETLVAAVEVDRIEKVFENLILNAIEAMGQKSGLLKIEAGPTAHGEVFFSVQDTGPGMSEEFQRTKLFRAFATTKKSGVGLGLYTCREIVRAHGGHIDVESRRGSGTTFRVVLPSEQKIMRRT